ncbi:MAG TPA: ABC transporter substrate-binding protein [Thermomicrobiales bacterium]|nr:ABC transporter substrate-binding protein [Thermomicrobiales bacterium]
MRLKMLGILLVVLALLPALVACGEDEGSGDLDEVTIGLTFVPNIQFAPFYVAIEQGYYEDAGVSVTLNHHAAGSDQYGALVAGQEDMMMAAGDEAMQVRAQDVDIVYVAEVFRKYPVALIVPADSDIASVSDLAGKKVGIPGEYGANYIGLLALLEQAGLTKDDIEIMSVGFTQAQALLSGEVDAITGYINNEPIQLQKAGMETRTFAVSEALPIVSNGLVAMEEYLSENGDQARAIIEATLRGVEYAIANPEETVEIAKEFVPTLEDEQQATDALAVLQATIPLWETNGAVLGSSNLDAWQQTADFLQENGLLASPVAVADVYSADYLPEE